MQNLRKGSHSVHQLHVHVVWSTKYRFQVLKGEVQIRCRDLIRQTCDTMDVQILKGVVSGDHIHLHLSYSPKVSVSDIIRRLRSKCSNFDDGVWRVTKTILGRSFLGNRLWGLEYREYNG